MKKEEMLNYLIKNKKNLIVLFVLLFISFLVIKRVVYKQHYKYITQIAENNKNASKNERECVINMVDVELKKKSFFKQVSLLYTAFLDGLSINDYLEGDINKIMPCMFVDINLDF